MASKVKLTAVFVCYYEDSSEKDQAKKGKIANPGETFSCDSDAADRFVALGAATRPGEVPVAPSVGETPPPVIGKTGTSNSDPTGGLA